MTAHDVAFTYGLIADPAVASPRSDFIEHMLPDARPEVIDDTHLRFRFDEAYDATTMISHSVGVELLPRHVLGEAPTDALAGHAYHEAPVTNGPFRLESRKRDQQVVLVPSEHWGGPEEMQPKLARVVHKVLPDYSTQLLELESGAVDLVPKVEMADADRLAREHPEISLHRRGWRAMEYVGWNQVDPESYGALQAKMPEDETADPAGADRHPLFGDVRVRTALSRAIDTEAMMTALFHSEAAGETYARRAVGTISPSLCHAHNDSIEPIAHDPGAATAGLAELGWSDTDGDQILDKGGRPFRFHLMIPSGNDQREREAVLIQAALKEIGVAVDIDPVEFNQWHIDASDRPVSTAVDDGSLAAVKVAVLDTGLAYEDHDDGVGLPSFNQVGISDPYDYVNDDDQPYDDHQHGSHIASVIASFTEEGYDGAVGIAPGVTVMPVKVLDANNAGYETYLLDALAWVVEKDAQIVNMSLSFGEGYVISAALDQALHDVREAGIVMVAAAGNDGASFVSYPANHRDVIAVGAGRLANNNKMKVPDYSNTHPRVDLLGAGGDISRDKNNDGVVDGVLAETIAMQDAGTAQYVLYAGTSQATAVVSAAAAWLLADDVHPDAVRHVLQRTAREAKGSAELKKGAGSGCVQIDAALSSVTSADRSGGPDDDVFVAVMPYIKWTDEDTIKPKAEVTVLDGSGSPIADAEVVGAITGSTAKFAACTTDADGLCTLGGKALEDYSEASDPGDLAWAVEVPTVVVDDVVHHPRTAFFASDALEILLAAIEAEPELADGLLGFHWPGESNEYGDLLESYFLVDLGVGLGGTPLGIIVPKRTFGDADATIDIDLDGTGLGGTPLGIVPIPRFDFDGTGLGGTPLGGRIIILGGGLGGTPLGWRPPGILGGGGLGGTPLGFHDSPFLNLDGHSVRLGNDWTCGTGLGGTALGRILDRGGWTQDGYGGASALVGSGDVGITASSIEGMIGSGDLEPAEFEDIVVCSGEDCGDDD